MPSIFVWKATTPNPSKKTIRYYSGSNWVLEDNDSSSHSYQYLQQIVIPGSKDDTVITFLVKSMPCDWIGSELLEITHVPYHHIRSDEYGTLEHIGNWMRFTSKRETHESESEFTKESVQREFRRIQQWMSSPTTGQVHTPPRPYKRDHTRNAPSVAAPIPSISLMSSISPQQIQKDFQEFYQTVATSLPPATPSYPSRSRRPPERRY